MTNDEMAGDLKAEFDEVKLRERGPYAFKYPTRRIYLGEQTRSLVTSLCGLEGVHLALDRVLSNSQVGRNTYFGRMNPIGRRLRALKVRGTKYPARGPVG